MTLKSALALASIEQKWGLWICLTGVFLVDLVPDTEADATARAILYPCSCLWDKEQFWRRWASSELVVLHNVQNYWIERISFLLMVEFDNKSQISVSVVLYLWF